MGRPVAYDTYPDGLHYRKFCFLKGLERLGYQTGRRPVGTPNPEDVLLIWNRPPVNDHHAKRFEAVGARVIVAENGYLGDDRFAIALGHHAGAGTWRDGGPQRWTSFNIPLAPWRRGGNGFLLLPSRGFGEKAIAQPPQWDITTLKDITRRTRRPVRVRPHPGRSRSDPGEDLKGAYAAVVWSSGAGIKALVKGIPVFYDFPKWIGAAAAAPLSGDLEIPFLGDREPMFRRMAWTLWNPEEVLAGEPFAWLLR